MPRPKKPRFVSAYPMIAAFVPQGVPVAGEVFLSVEELEAIRLSDFERLDQESAANLMQVSRQTYGRILANARGIVGEALVTGKALKVEGGHYEMRGRHRQRRGRFGRRGREHITEENIDMPRGDGTGPEGQGNRKGTGRGKGRCGRNSESPDQAGRNGGDTGQGPGQGQGRGGGGRKGQGGGQGRGRNR